MTPVARERRIVLEVRVVPRASANELIARDGGLVVRVTAPPVEGKANEAVVRTVAKALDLAPSEVELVRGTTGRTKTLSVPASAEAAVRRMLK